MNHVFSNAHSVRYTPLTPAAEKTTAPLRHVPHVWRTAFKLGVGLLLAGGLVLAGSDLPSWSEAGLLSALVVFWVVVLAWKGLRHA